jgi:hypothetical protein
MSDQPDAQAGQRRPTDQDLQPLLERIWNGASLRAACRELGLHAPATSDWLYADDGRSEQYARAREGRAECQQEEALEVSRAAATGSTIEVDGEYRKVDAAGARVLLDAIKWASARMAPKTAPVQRIDLTSRTRQMSDAEIEDEIAAREARATDEA